MPPLRRSLPRAKYTSQHRLAQAQAEAPGQGSADRIPGTSLLIRNRRLPLQPDAHLNPTLRQHRKPYSHSHHRGSNSATTCIGDHAHAQPMLALESSAPTSCSPACDLKGESSCDSKTKNDAHRKLSLAVPLDATAPEELHGNCPSTPTPRDRLRKTRFRHQLEPREQLEQNGEAQLPEAMQVHGQEHCNNQVDDEAYVGAPLTFLAGPKGTVGLSPQDGDRSVHSPAYLNSAVPSAGENSGEFGDSGVSIQEDIEDCTEEDLGNNDVTDLDSDATHPDSAVSQHALPDPSVSPVHPRRDCVETDLCSLRPTATTSPARLINPRSSINTNRDHPSKSLHDVSMKAPTMLFHQPQKAPGATRALTSLQFQLGKESNRSCARDGLLEKEAPEAVSSDLAHNSTWIQSEQTHVSKMPQTGTPSPPFLPQCTDVEDASSTVPGRGGQGNTERRTPADLVFAPVSEGFGRIRAYTLLASGQQDQVNIDSQARLAVLGAFTDRVPDDEPNGCVKYSFSLNDDSLPDMHLAGTNSQVGMPTLPQSPRLHRDPSKPAETSPTAITSGELQQHSSHAPHAERSSSPRICQEAPLRPHPAGLGYCHNHDPNIEHGLADTCERPLPFQAAPQDAAVPSSFQPELEELLVPANASVDFGDVSFSSVGVEGADPTLESTTRPAHQIGVEKDRTTKPAIARPTHPRTSWAHAVADKLGRDWYKPQWNVDRWEAQLAEHARAELSCMSLTVPDCTIQCLETMWGEVLQLCGFVGLPPREECHALIQGDENPHGPLGADLLFGPELEWQTGAMVRTEREPSPALRSGPKSQAEAEAKRGAGAGAGAGTGAGTYSSPSPSSAVEADVQPCHSGIAHTNPLVPTIRVHFLAPLQTDTLHALQSLGVRRINN